MEFKFKENLTKEGFNFDMLSQSTNCSTYEIPSINKCEFVNYTENRAAIVCKTSEATVDVLDSQTLQLICKLDTE